MADPLVARLRDRLTLNAPYAGLVAEGYDTWIPVDEELPDEAVYLDLLGRVGGPVLELGCGTGRPLLRWLALGFDVEGLDSSADMLLILRRHAQERGLEPVVHLGDMAPLSLDRRFAAIVCPAGTFTLIGDAERARHAIASYLAHLHPGGTLALSAYVPVSDFDEQLAWRVRRTGTTAGGTTIVVHEAVRCDVHARVQVVYNRVESYDAGGRLLETFLRRTHLRWWPKEDLEREMREAGFADVGSVGGDDAWVTIARAPR
jgi:SAM-dependent methyltransferase